LLKKLRQPWSMHESVPHRIFQSKLLLANCLVIAAVCCGGCTLPFLTGGMPTALSPAAGCGSCVENDGSCYSRPQGSLWPTLPAALHPECLCSVWLATPHEPALPAGPVEAPPPPRFHPVPVQPVFGMRSPQP